jgi:hypothetical protein
MGCLAIGARVLAVADGLTSEDPQTTFEHNRRLLEKWRADPEHYARLHRDYQSFLALPPERQARVRKLDKDLHAQDPAMQARLWTVLERYTSWLEKLSDGDRNWIESASDSSTRLERVNHIRDQQWVKRLPQKIQKDLAELPEDKRPERIAELRLEERQRRLEWFWSSHPRDVAALKRARPTRIAEFPPEVRFYYGNSLYHLLSKTDRERLNSAEGSWPLYARTLAELIAKTPPPEVLGFPQDKDKKKNWPLRMEDLPPDWRIALNSLRTRFDQNGQKLGKKGLSAEQKRRNEELVHLNRSLAGKWPDFAVMATNLVRMEKLKVESAIGPSKDSDLALATRLAVQNELLVQLTEDEKTDLKSKEGKWPEYPQRLFELAKKHKVPLPGTYRPCNPSFWEGTSKLLPDVSDRVLRTFALNDLTPDERGELKLSTEDAASRDRLIEKYWARHPKDLDRQLHPPKSKRP